MRKIKRFMFFFRLWMMKQLGYKLPSLREATPVIPKQLYDHFCYVVEAVPTSRRFKPICEYGDNIPEQCDYCELMKLGLPCSFNHKMANGEDICNRHVFLVHCKNKYNI